MFALNRTYVITMLEAHGQDDLAEMTYYGCKVTDIEWPVVRFNNGMIVNVSSPRFVKAKEEKNS